MTLSEALKKWDYRCSKQKKDLLKKLQVDHPEMYASIDQADSLLSIKKPYLPDGRIHDSYTHIVRAVKSCSVLYPETISIDNEHMKLYVDQLCRAGLIGPFSDESSSTLDYGTTLKTSEWLNAPAEKKHKLIQEYISAAKPDLHFHVG